MLGLDLNFHGPQTGKWGRVNPIHTMIYSGTDAVSGVVEKYDIGIYCADDYITMRYSALCTGMLWARVL